MIREADVRDHIFVDELQDMIASGDVTPEAIAAKYKYPIERITGWMRGERLPLRSRQHEILVWFEEIGVNA